MPAPSIEDLTEAMLEPGIRAEAAEGSTLGTADAILSAALKMFARNGFDGTSVQDIARLAGVRHPLIHYHFGSKEKLWYAVIDRLFGELRRYFAALNEVATDLNALQTLKLICRAFVHVTARSPERIMIVRHEIWSSSPRVPWLLETHIIPIHRIIDAVAERAIAEGSLKPIPPAHFSHLLIGAATSFFLAQPLVLQVYAIDSRDPQVIAEHANWLIEAIFDGLTERKGGED